MAASDIQTPVIADGQNGTSIRKPVTPVEVTTANTEKYIHACALSHQKASGPDPLTRLFQAEKLAALPGEDVNKGEDGTFRPTPASLQARLSQLTQDQIEDLIYASACSRMNRYIAAGGFVVEAGDFAATTVWEPAFAPLPDDPDPRLDIILADRRDHHNFNSFLAQIEKVKHRVLYPVIWQAQKNHHTFNATDDWSAKVLSNVSAEKRAGMYWHLTLTSRNPAVQPPVPGAVRAVIEPFVKNWLRDGLPAVWLEAGSPHARDIYGYFGFRVVGEVVISQDEAGNGGITTWCMMATRDEIRYR